MTHRVVATPIDPGFVPYTVIPLPRLIGGLTGGSSAAITIVRPPWMGPIKSGHSEQGERRA